MNVIGHILIFIWLSLAVQVPAVRLELTSANDAIADPTSCFPASTDSCNLRSAWETCNQLNEVCVISIPENTLIVFDSSLGHLSLNSTANIEIIGAGSTITNSNPENNCSFARWEKPASSVGIVPTLVLRSLSVVGFQNDGVIGGAMAFVGDVALTIESCTFAENSALSGGAIYISDNAQGVQIIDTLFQGCSAEQGGAITLQSMVRAASVTGSEFIRCRAVKSDSAAGGAIFLQKDNYHLNITNTRFTECNAVNGGGIYGQEANNGLRVENVTFDRCTTSNDGGGIYLWSNHHDIKVANTMFADCSGRYGAGMCVWQSSADVQIIGSSFLRGSATQNGGGAFFAYNNLHVHIVDTLFARCDAVKYGGGVGFSSGNNHLLVDSTTFTSCTAMYGGGSSLENSNMDATFTSNRYISCEATDATEPLSAAGGGAYNLYQNERLLLRDNLFADCTSSGYAGALYIDYYSANPVVTQNHFERCTAGQTGGAIWFYRAEKLTVALSTFVDCNAKSGGAIYVETLCHDFHISDCTVSRCSATEHGGGLYIGTNSVNGTIQGSNFTDCHAGGFGGGIYADSTNNNLRVADSIIDSCSAFYGGGFLSGRNRDVVIERSRISNCIADKSGGGVNFLDRNDRILVINSEISNNTAGTHGGGLVSEGLNSALFLVGTSFLHNEAATSGGGVYLATGNPQFTVIDTDGYANMRVVESRHPYGWSNTVAETVTIAGAAALILYFDQLTRIARQDFFRIYADASREVLLLNVHESQDWPGTTLPPLRIEGDSFFVELSTFWNFYIPQTVLADNVYGFKLYVTPVMLTPARSCVFDHNIAGSNGGGLFMFSGVAFPIILHATFSANEAVDGGGVALRNAITGMTIEACRFEQNQAFAGNGGGLLVASASYGLLVLNCVFANNYASLGGGGLAFTNNNGNDGQFLIRNYNVLQRCTFLGNSVAADGAAISAALNNEFEVVDCQLSGNQALQDGGAVAVISTNTLRMERCAMFDNIAFGAVLWLLESRTRSP